MKDIDFKRDNNQFILHKSSVIDDTLYPYNFLYMFSGLPEYGTDGIASKVSKGPFITKQSLSISLNESFIPFSEIVVDDSGRVYTLQLTRTSNIKGTYTIEPYSGIVRVTPYDSTNSVSISYNRAMYNRKPCGILFNRLLTFVSLDIFLTEDNSEFFSIDGSEIEKKIILPNISPTIQHSQLLFNTNADMTYLSSRIELL